MPTTINHVSVNALNLSESVDFYVELLGAEPIPTPNFGVPVQWLALGRTQLHLFERGGHGFGMYPKETTSTGWFDEFVRWLGMHGMLKPVA